MSTQVQAPVVRPADSQCTPAQAGKLRAAYHVAGTLARQAEQYTRSLRARCARGRSLAWSRGPAARYFGGFSEDKVRAISAVIGGVNRRFRVGFAGPTTIDPTHIQCFSPKYRRCQKGLLANASIFGTIRVCPRLLQRPTHQVAEVLLHEMLHQGLGVGDRRHPACGSSRDRRCYRDGALQLVDAGRSDLALRNNDNYVGFVLALTATDWRNSQ